MARRIRYHGFRSTKGGWWIIERIFADGKKQKMDESFDKQYIMDRCAALNQSLVQSNA